MWTSSGAVLLALAVAGLPVVNVAPLGSCALSHVLLDCRFQTSIHGRALTARTVMLPVVGLQVRSAVSPTVSRWTSVAAPVQAEILATLPAPLICARTEPAAPTFEMVAVHPLRVIVPAVTPLLKSFE